MSISPIFDAVSGFFGSIMKPVSTIVEGWQQRQTAQLASDLKVREALTTAKITQIAATQAGDIAWENTAIATSGWKSGYLTVVLSLPLICMFVPPLVPYIAQGFDAISKAPPWYTAAVGVMIAADFGYRKFADLMSLKNGVNLNPAQPSQ